MRNKNKVFSLLSTTQILNLNNNDLGLIFALFVGYDLGAGTRRLMRGLAALPQSNQEPLMLKTRLEKPQMSSG